MKPIYESMKESFCRDIYRLRSNVVAAPVATVFADVGFPKTAAQTRPQTVFFRLDENLNVLSGGGETVAPLYDCLSVGKFFVPVFCLENDETAEKLSDFVYYNALGDAALCVPYEKREVLEQALRLMPMLRGMLDCRSLGNAPDWLFAAGQAWKSHAISVVISKEQCQRAVADLLHERLLTVWCEADGEDARVMFDGVDGVITDSAPRVYSILERLPQHSLLDRYRVFAHKGFQNGYTLAENSITAVRAGAEHALDGAEIDVKLTTDNIPFVIHNPSTKAMLKGEERVVETLSSAELESRERTDFAGEYTDRLEAMLQATAAYPHFPIFIEFKPAPQFYHIERMTHEIKGIIERTGAEYRVAALNGPEGMAYIQRLLPTLPKLNSVWEKPEPPTNAEQANEMLYRFSQRIAGTPAVMLVEDVMVNRLFGEAAAARGILTVVWTRSWYFKHSTWEEDGERSDEGFLSGFYATISDHAEHYLDIPVRIDRNREGDPVGIMRDGTERPLKNKTLFDLGNGYSAWGTEIVLPHGAKIHLFSGAFRK